MSRRFIFDLQMRFGDEDSYAHVNNVTYLRYLEEARVRFLHSVAEGVAEGVAKHAAHDGAAGEGEQPGSTGPTSADPTFKDLEPEASAPVIGSQKIEYLRQLHWRPEPLPIYVWVSAIGGSSYVLDYLVGAPSAGEAYAIAQTTIVQIDKRTGRPVKLGAPLRAALEQYRDAPLEFRRSV